MNNKLVINFVPGPTPVHKLAGSTKVLMFLLFTAAIIATFDIRVIAALMIVPIIAIISMRPNYKPLIVLLSVMLVTTGVIGSIMLLIVSPDTGFSHVGGSTIIWQAMVRLRKNNISSKNDRTSYFQNISVPHRRRFSIPHRENRNAAFLL